MDVTRTDKPHHIMGLSYDIVTFMQHFVYKHVRLLDL